MQTREVTTQHLKIVSAAAAKYYRRLTPGCGVDLMDLESAGNEALAKMVSRYADQPDESFLRLINRGVMNAMINEVRRLTHKGKAGPVGLPSDDDGIAYPVVDRSADDPADAAEAIEAADIAVGMYEGLPGPLEVAAKARAMKAAIMSAITVPDVAEIVQMQVRKAKAGSLKAAQFVMGIVNAQ